MPDLTLINADHFKALETIKAEDHKQNFQQLIDAVNLLKAQFEDFKQEGIRYAGGITTPNVIVSMAGMPSVATQGTSLILLVESALTEATLLTLKLNAWDVKPVVAESGMQLRGKDLPQNSLVLLTYTTAGWVASAGLLFRKPYWIAPTPVNHETVASGIRMIGKLEVPASSGGIIYQPATANITVRLDRAKLINGRDYTDDVTVQSTHVLYAVANRLGTIQGYVFSKSKEATRFFLATDPAKPEEYTEFPHVRQLPFHFIPRESGTMPQFNLPVWQEDYAEFEYNRIARGFAIADIPADDGDPDNDTIFQDKLLLRDRSPIGYTQASTFKWVPVTSEYMTVYGFCNGAGEMVLYNIDEPDTAPGNRMVNATTSVREHSVRIKISKDPPRFAYKVVSGNWRLQVGGYITNLNGVT